MTKHVMIHIKTGNAAFGDTPNLEVARILISLAAKLTRETLDDINASRLRDINGNQVGIVKIMEMG